MHTSRFSFSKVADFAHSGPAQGLEGHLADIPIQWLILTVQVAFMFSREGGFTGACGLGLIGTIGLTSPLTK